MKRFVALTAAVVAAFSLAGIASAATPQGHLGGAGNVSTTIGIQRVEVNSTINDGTMSYVGLNNDKSGNCNGDTGQVNVNYTAANGSPNSQFTVTCAHFTNTTSGGWMQFSWHDTNLNTYVVFRIGDRGQNAGLDKFEYTTTATATDAQSIVNLGTRTGSLNGYPALTHSSTSGGNWQLSA